MRNRYFASVRTKDELKTEFRRLTMENHPDKGGDPVKMREIIEKYNELLEKGIVIRYEEITAEDVDQYFDDVAEVMDFEDDFDFVDMEML